MRPGISKLTISGIATVLLLALIALTGCAEIEVVDTLPAASTPDTFISPLSAGSKNHNLAVLAIDFDPPLNYQQLILRQQSIALLVAVENTGTDTERDVMVRAQLTSPEDPDLLMTQGASVTSIAPGEIKVVRFARLGKIPYHQTYHLEAWVELVDGESNAADNHRAFEIQIHQDQEKP